MVAPNRQSLVAGKIVIVTLASERRAAVSVGNSHPQFVDLSPFLDAGLDDVAALDTVLKIVSIGVSGATG